VYEPLDFLAKLAALVPRPRVNLTRYRGVFAPNSAMTWAHRLKRVFGIDIKTCAVCGGTLSIIACIEEPAGTRRRIWGART